MLNKGRLQGIEYAKQSPRWIKNPWWYITEDFIVLYVKLNKRLKLSKHVPIIFIIKREKVFAGKIQPYLIRHGYCINQPYTSQGTIYKNQKQVFGEHEFEYCVFSGFFKTRNIKDLSVPALQSL